MNHKKLRETGLVGDDQPKFTWESDHTGQANYIAIRCHEEGIRVVTCGQQIMLFSKKKIPDLLKIIEESTKYLVLPTPAVSAKSEVIRSEHTILGVHVANTDTCYTVEKNFPLLMYRVFMKELPSFKKYRIMNSFREMREVLERDERILI